MVNLLELLFSNVKYFTNVCSKLSIFFFLLIACSLLSSSPFSPPSSLAYKNPLIYVVLAIELGFFIKTHVYTTLSVRLVARLFSSKLSSLKRRKISPFRGLEKGEKKKRKRNVLESRIFDALKVSLIGKAWLSRKFSELNTRNVGQTLKGTDKKSN